MADLGGFNAAEVEPNSAFELLPEGWHKVIIVGSEICPTNNGKGEYLKLEMEIIEGAHKGRKIFDQLMWKHSESAKAVEIGRGKISAICRAVNVPQPGDSINLHNIPLAVKVGFKKREDNGEMTNVVKGYAEKDKARATPGPTKRGPAATGASPAPQPVPAAGQGDGAKAPWER